MNQITEESIHGLARDMLHDREKVLRTVIKSLQTTHTMEQGCSRVLENFDEYMENPENLKKQLKTAIKTNKQLSATMLQVLSILLIYITSNDFQSGAASLMARTGDPMEALQEMMKAKMRGGR
jgi:hypothetical protein